MKSRREPREKEALREAFKNEKRETESPDRAQHSFFETLKPENAYVVVILKYLAIIVIALPLALIIFVSEYQPDWGSTAIPLALLVGSLAIVAMMAVERIEGLVGRWRLVLPWESGSISHLRISVLHFFPAKSQIH